MRYIALFLLIANLAYFGWLQSGYAPDIVVPDVPARPLLNTGLSLLSEFETEQSLLEQERNERNRLCSQVSGFATLDDAMLFVDEAEASGLGASLALGGNPLPSQFRVFLPPASSRAIATLMLEDFSTAAAQLEIESYLVTRGPLQNAIALGVYDSRGAALLAQEAGQSLGFSPEIQELPRSDGAIEVLLSPGSGQRVEDPEWLDLSAQRPGLTRLENLCQSVAQAGQFP